MLCWLRNGRGRESPEHAADRSVRRHSLLLGSRPVSPVVPESTENLLRRRRPERLSYKVLWDGKYSPIHSRPPPYQGVIPGRADLVSLVHGSKGALGPDPPRR